MQEIIDLRSDTLTTPCNAMRKHMADAAVGDDVFSEDPSITKLEAKTAELAHHEAGLFFPSGTQSNLVAILSHCQRGDEYIVGQNAHTYKFEGGGAAVLGSVQPQPIENSSDGSIPLAKIRAAIKPDDFHFANTRMLALENTIGGKVLDQHYIQQAGKLARESNLVFHLDGARAFNAAAAQGIELHEITQQFDSVSLCMSKGLGAPVGSVLVGSRDYISQARRWRKMVGGGMRQAGMLAAAASYALDHNVMRLTKDHDLAQRLAQELLKIDGLHVHGGSAQTNMLFLSLASNSETSKSGEQFLQYCKSQGLLFTGNATARLVIYKGITEQMIDRAVLIIQGFFD